MSIVNCPNCGAPAKGDQSQKLLSCEYCGSSFANPFYTEEDRTEKPASQADSSVACGTASPNGPMPQQPGSGPAPQQPASRPAPQQPTPQPTPQPDVIVPPKASEKSLKVAQFWAIVLGYYGIHRFYAGKIGTGLIWMFTGGCFFIGWIYDISTLCGQRFTDSHGQRIVSKSSIILPDNTLACSACGHSIDDGAKKCPNCGAEIKKWWQTGFGFVLVWILLALLAMLPGSCSQM